MSEPKGWHKSSIRDLGGRGAVQTGPFGAELHADDYVSSGVPLVLIRNIGKGEVHEAGLPLITQRDAQRLSNYSLEAGDIVFSRVGRVGSCFLANERQAGWIISGQLLRLRIPDEAIDKRFLLHHLLSEPIQAAINDKSVGTTRQSINTSILEQLTLRFPSRVEQQRVASILDTLDEVMASTERLIAKLEQAKQGLLSDFLTCGIDESGDVRDPETNPAQFAESPFGKIPNCWRVSNINSVTTKIVDGVHATPNYQITGVPFITVENLTRGSGISFEPSRKISLADHYLFTKRADPHPGDILVSKDGTLGVSRVVPLDSPEFSIFVSVAMLRPAHDLIRSKFMQIFFESDGFRRQLGYQSSGTGLKHIHLNQFRLYQLGLPSLQEQDRILAVLGGYERARSMELNYLRKLHLLKQALMDDLLTGKVSTNTEAASG